MMYVVPRNELTKMLEILMQLWNRFEIIVEKEYAKILLLPHRNRTKMPELTYCIEVNTVIGRSGIVTVSLKRELKKVLEEAIAYGGVAIIDDIMVPAALNIVRSGNEKRLYIRVGKNYSGRILKQLCVMG